ncbi:hypothetical protein BJX65DRAFT_296555 [Aspergillus insuetus]
MIFKCQTCSAQFQRDDHLQRHQLSHSEPRYKCADRQCGMRFHRRDAVRRHEKSHQRNGKQRRRKPRRGVLPCPRISMRKDPLLRPSDVIRVGSNHDDALSPFLTVDADSVDSQAKLWPFPSPEAKNNGETSGVLLDCVKCATINMLCNECISCLLAGTGLAEDHFSAFQFCLQHYVRVHAREFPFLHSSSWRTSWELSGKAFAMAAIGGCQIPSYGGHSRLYFDLAVSQVKDFTAFLDGAEYQNAPGTATWNDGCYRRLLTSFETYILLIRYSVWSELADLREWGIKTLADHAITVVPTLAKVVSNNPHNSTSWLLWILLEESKRALWCFYCLAVKCRHFLHYSISTCEVVVRNIHLPCPDSLFEAPDEQTWKGLNDSNVPQQLIGSTVPSQIAFYHLMSQQPMPQLIPRKVGTYTSQILLCNLLNTYETGRTISCNFTSLDAYLNSDMSRFRLCTELIRALDYWKWLFWRDPHELWHSRHPDHQINNMMLCVYLEVQMWSSSAPHLLSASHRRAAAQLAFDMLSSISRTGFLEYANTFFSNSRSGRNRRFTLNLSSISAHAALARQCSPGTII